MSPPVLAPEQLGLPPSAVEQNEEQTPLAPTRRQVLPFWQSLAAEQVSPGFLALAPAGALAHCAPV